MASVKPKDAGVNLPATTGGAQLPDYLKDFKGKSGLVGLDTSDFILPRVKLLQDVSEEPKAFDKAKSGQFWINVIDYPVGPSFDFIVCSNRKRYLLLPPMGDSRGILARAEDGIHWTPPDGEWQVKLKNVKNPVTWKTAPTVRASGLGEFGSSNPDDPESNPAATLFYDYLIYSPTFPQFSPVLFSLARSQGKRARDLNGKIEFRKAPMQSQLFRATPTEETNPDGQKYWNVAFSAAGWATREVYDECCLITERFKTYRAADEEQQGKEEQSKTAPAERGEI